MAIYCQGLKNSVKNKLMQYRADFRNLKDFICISIKLDDKIFFRFMEKQGTKPRYNWTGFAYWNYFREDHNLSQGDLMELDTMQVKKIFKGKKRASKRKETQKYYAYNNIKHIARNCSSKNKVEKQHFNIVNI